MRDPLKRITGNVLFLGVGIAGSTGASVAPPLVGVAAFVARGLAGGYTATQPGDSPGRGIAIAVAIEAPLIAVAELPTTVLTVAVSGLTAAAPAAASSDQMTARAVALATGLTYSALAR